MTNRILNSKVGSVSVSTVNFNSWASTPVTVPKSKKTKQKEIVNNVFVECAKTIEDPFWIEKFNLASIGKFPANFYFNDNTLTYRKGAKNNRLALSPNSREAALEVIKFFQVNKSIFSPTDEQIALNSQFNRSNANLDPETLTWETASKKIKECLISYFVVDMMTMMKLSNEQGNQLKQIINVGIFSNVFDKNNITLNNNRIFSIGGLFYDPENKVFYIDPNLEPSKNRTYSKKSTTNALPKDTIPQFNSKWDKLVKKYVDQMNKQPIISTMFTMETMETDDEDEDD